MERYQCGYCNLHFHVYQNVICHLVEVHKQEYLHYRELRLCSSTGKMGYMNIRFPDIIPFEIDDAGKVIVPSKGSIIIETEHSLHTPHSKKRIKASTPKKTDDSCCQKLNFSQDVEMSQNESSELAGGSKYVTELETSSESEDDADLNRIKALLPYVIDNLRTVGHLDSYVKFCQLVADDKLPYDNICYLLFLDLIEWYCKDSSTQMRYRCPETLQFWRIGYRLFKGKFLRFMSGPKSAGNLISDNEYKGSFDPHCAKVNFAIPSKNNLCDALDSSVQAIYPGVMEDTLKLLSNVFDGNPAKLAVDGKKISRGRGASMGDIDLWGFEPSPKLNDRKERHQFQLKHVENTSATLEKCTVITSNLRNICNKKDEFVPELQQMISSIGGRLQDLRQMKLTTERAIVKFTTLAGDNWRKSRFFPLIASLRTTKYDIDKAIEDGLALVDKLSFYGAILNEAAACYSRTCTVDLSTQSNYRALEPFSGDTHDPSIWRFIPQRTEDWFEIRRKGKVTGSTCHCALGLDTPRRQQDHFDNVIHEKPKAAFSKVQTDNMAFGTTHAIHGVATTVSKIMPLYYPELVYFEEGCQGIIFNGTPLLIASPDGSLRTARYQAPALMYETKCKPTKDLTMSVYYELPRYYVLQVLCEMRSYNCSRLLFTCWSLASTVAIEVLFDEELWKQVWDELVVIYDPANPVRPQRLTAGVRTLQSAVVDFTKTSCRFLGEFPSVTSIVGINANATLSKEDESVCIDSVLKDFRGLHKWYDIAYQLTRPEATEILVYMITDLDRTFHTEQSNGHPIAYAMKGPSMSSAIFQEMTDLVISKVEQHGITVGVTSADGQWHRYGVRDADEKPLTQLQLQKDVWARVRRRQKSELLHGMKEIMRVEPSRLMECVIWEKSTTGPLIVMGHLVYKHVPVLRPSLLRFFQTKGTFAATTADLYDTEPSAEQCQDVLDDFLLQTCNASSDSFDLGTIMTLENIASAQLPTIQQPIPQMSCADAIGDALQLLYYNPDCCEFDDGYKTSTATSSVCGHEAGVNVPPSYAKAQMDAVESPNAPDTQMQNEAPTIQSCINGENGTSMQNVLTEDDFRKVKQDLEKCKGKRRPNWGDMETANFKLKFANANTINKEFTRNELVCILRTLTGHLKSRGIKFGLSQTKPKLVNLLATLLGDGSSIPQVTRKPHTPKSLRALCAKCISNKYTKELLNIIFSEYEWIDELEHWRTESVQFLHDPSYNYHGRWGWFSKPRVDTTGSIKFHFTDACHILTCLRTKVCTTGIAGLSKKAWEEAALSADTKLNIALVVECLDKQSVAFAKMVFAADVQGVMRRNGYQKEAYFCQCISDWFAAEDEPGISAIMRCERRLKLRDWLLHGVDFGLYPPYSSYINGIPAITYEALLLQVERKLQMFALRATM